MGSVKAEVQKFHEIKRFINVSDTHFGIRSNSLEWMDIHREYFMNFFIPLIKKNYRKGDAIIHTGDVFDSRQSLNLKVMNMGMEIFEELAKIMPVFVICGNHDIYYKKSNEVNSVKIFNWLDNVHVYEEPVMLELNKGKTKALLMPWCDTHEEEQEIIDANPADYLFCHTDMRGLKFNSRVEVDEGLESESFSGFKKVFSGHIHYAQKNKNIRMVGSPYQLTRSDIGNVKHVWFLDFTDDSEEGVVNDYSPQFMRIKLEKALEMRIEDLKRIIDNNFVDIMVNSSWSSSFPFNSFLELFADVNYRKFSFVITTMGEGDELDLENDAMRESVDLQELINIYIDNMQYKDAVKTKLKESARNLYQRCIRSTEDETIG